MDYYCYYYCVETYRLFGSRTRIVQTAQRSILPTLFFLLFWFFFSFSRVFYSFSFGISIFSFSVHTLPLRNALRCIRMQALAIASVRMCVCMYNVNAFDSLWIFLGDGRTTTSRREEEKMKKWHIKKALAGRAHSGHTKLSIGAALILRCVRFSVRNPSHFRSNINRNLYFMWFVVITSIVNLNAKLATGCGWRKRTRIV